MNFFLCQICETKAAVLKCHDCTIKNPDKSFFCYNCSKEAHSELQKEEILNHKIHKLSFLEIKLLIERPYNAHSIVPISLKSGKGRSHLYVKGRNISDVKSEYQKVKENFEKLCEIFNNDVLIYTDKIQLNNSIITQLEYLVEKQYEEYAQLVADKEKVQLQIVEQGEVMQARIKSLKEMINICEEKCKSFMSEKGEFLAESARKLDRERKDMLERITKKEAELITPLRTELKQKRMKLKNLKSKILLKKNMNLAQDIEVTRKTKTAIERILMLKDDNNQLDKEFRQMLLELLKIEPKIEILKLMVKSAKKKKKAAQKKEKLKALDIVKESVRIYGAKNLNKILKGELSK